MTGIEGIGGAASIQPSLPPSAQPAEELQAQPAERRSHPSRRFGSAALAGAAMQAHLAALRGEEPASSSTTGDGGVGSPVATRSARGLETLTADVTSAVRSLADLADDTLSGLGVGVLDEVRSGLEGVATSAREGRLAEEALSFVGRMFERVRSLDSQPVLGARPVTPAEVEREPTRLSYVANDGGWDTAAWALLTGDTRGPQSMKEVVDRAEADAGGQPIDSIEFCGHGNDGFQSIGPDGTREGKLKMPLTGEQVEQLERLGSLMSEDGVIILGGCNLAEGEKGRKLIAEIARITGRRVEAGVDTQYPMAGIEGRKITALPPDGSLVEQP